MVAAVEDGLLHCDDLRKRGRIACSGKHSQNVERDFQRLLFREFAIPDVIVRVPTYRHVKTTNKVVATTVGVPSALTLSLCQLCYLLMVWLILVVA